MPKVSEEHRLARRAQILRAAVICFAQDGFHRTSMQAIIDRSALSAGAIYQYFESKEDIVQAIAEERHREESALIARFAASDDVAEGLRVLARDFFALLERPGERRRRRVSVQVWAEALRNERVMRTVREGLDQIDVVADALRAAHAAGRLPRDLDPAGLARVALALMQGFILQQAWEPGLPVDGYAAAVRYLIDAAFAR